MSQCVERAFEEWTILILAAGPCDSRVFVDLIDGIGFCLGRSFKDQPKLQPWSRMQHWQACVHMLPTCPLSAHGFLISLSDALAAAALFVEHPCSEALYADSGVTIGFGTCSTLGQSPFSLSPLFEALAT